MIGSRFRPLCGAFSFAMILTASASAQLPVDDIVAGPVSCERTPLPEGSPQCSVEASLEDCTEIGGIPIPGEVFCAASAFADLGCTGHPCPSGLPGVCATGTWQCAEGDLKCVADIQPGQLAEKCDGLDNDCDAESDEDFVDLGESCTAGVGECAQGGSTACAADGAETECSAVPGAGSNEICDTLDNDCDGASDEDFVDLGESCTAGVGECAREGSNVCTADGLGTECSATPGESTDEICDGLDNDCNGLPDDGSLCDDGNDCTIDSCGAGECTSRPKNDDTGCDSGKGRCQDGVCLPRNLPSSAR